MILRFSKMTGFMIGSIGQSILSTVYSSNCSYTTQVAVGIAACVSSSALIAYKIDSKLRGDVQKIIDKQKKEIAE